MWRIPYIGFLILTLCPSWYRTIWFALLCAVFVFCVMWVMYRLHLRMVARAIRVRFDERLDSMLQTLQGIKLVTDDALERSHDSVHMRRTLEKISGWLGQATQEGQAALNSLRAATTDSHKKG